MPSNPTLKITQGATLRRVLRTPWNLTGYTATAQLRDEHGDGIVRGTFTCTLQTNPITGLLGQVELLLPAAITEGLTPGKSDYAFDVKLVSPSAEVTYIPRIWLKVSDRVTV